jgi:hypothetical protein
MIFPRRYESVEMSEFLKKEFFCFFLLPPHPRLHPSLASPQPQKKPMRKFLWPAPHPRIVTDRHFMNAAGNAKAQQ